ncbi:MAG: hypothetical protein P8X74_00070 [Reinekea sp.]|jgi:hypothetical protein
MMYMTLAADQERVTHFKGLSSAHIQVIRPVSLNTNTIDRLRGFPGNSDIDIAA